MNAAKMRSLLRWGHLAEAAFIGWYVYSPAHSDPFWTDVMRFFVIPLATVSGLWMWQQGRISRWARHGRGPIPAR